VSDNPFFGGQMPDEEKLRQFLARFGIVPGPDGELDPAQILGRLQGIMSQFGTQMAGYGPSDKESGMNWAFAKSIALNVLGDAADGASGVSLSGLRDAVALADLWLDDAIAFPRIAAVAQVWTPREWVEQTFGVWQELIAPVVTSVSVAIQGLMPASDDPMQPAMRPLIRMAATGVLANQVGQSLGGLARWVLSGGELGLPLTRQPLVAFVGANVAAYSDGLDAAPADVVLFLALRETARQRLFGATPWLGPQLLALVAHYAAGISIDPSAIEGVVANQFDAGDIADMERAGQEVARSLFSPAVTSEQREILGRLETLLALVEGWVDDVVEQVMRPRVPVAPTLMETLRRRRASGGPAPEALKSLIGLELAPRRVRDAANTWAATRAANGAAARDAAWSHPDRMPASTDLDDPLGFAEHGRANVPDDGFDAALEELLRGDQGE